MRRDAFGVLEDHGTANGAPVLSEEAWQEILAKSLSEVAERREQERRARADREREERMKYAFD